MIFTELERNYLTDQALGRLATIGPAGPQNLPTTYRVNPGTETVDIGGPTLSDSQKFRNIQIDPRVSLVIDDVTAQPVGPGRQRGRGIEIRGTVELLYEQQPLMAGFSDHVLRIHPRRIVAWNIGAPGDYRRNVNGDANL